MAKDNFSLNEKKKKEIKKISWQGLIVNLGLSLAKFILGFVGHSQAVIADAVHSLSDLSTDIAVIFGSEYWLKPPDEGHPYGHKRIEAIVVTFIGIVLFTAGAGLGYRALISVREAQLRQPGIIAFLAALAFVVIKEVLYRYTLRVGKRTSSQAVIANAWHHRADALSSLPVVLAVGIALVNDKWIFLDNLAALVVSLFILYAAVKVIKPVLLEVLGTAAPLSLREDIYNIVSNTSGVESLHAVRTRKMGGDWFVDLHIQVNSQITVRAGHNISEAVKKNLLNSNKNIIDVVVHLEPHE
jgi:cation diffusion facilitator family transporter